MSTDPKDRWLDLGSFIREQRGSARLSLRRLSELAGISNPYLSQIERGLRRPSAEILQQIAKALRISAETLYVQAGILEAPSGSPDLTRAIMADQSISEEQKQALVRIYLSFRRDHEDERGEQAPGGRRSRRGTPSPSRPTPERLTTVREPAAPPEAWPERVSRPPVGSDRHAPARGPLPPHVPPGPAGHGRRRRHERLRPGADLGPGPLRTSPVTCSPGPGRPICRPWSTSSRACGCTMSRPGPSTALPKESLPAVVDEFTAGVLERMAAAGAGRPGELPYTSVHANYWLSGLSGHVIKHELNLPLVCTFHTLDRVKAESMPEEVEADMPHRRAEAEASIIDCSDAVLASCTRRGRPDRLALRRRARAHPHRAARRGPRVLRPRPPAPGPARPRAAARRAAPALRRADPAAQVRRRGHRDAGRAARARAASRYRLVVVGGPSGPHGEKSLQGLHDVADARGRARARPLHRRPSPTSCCRRTTGPPTSASSPAAPSRSGWSRWRRPPAGRRSSPRPSAG